MSKTYNHKEYALALADALERAAVHIKENPTYNIGDNHDVSVENVEIEIGEPGSGDGAARAWICRYTVVDEFSTCPANEHEVGMNELIHTSCCALMGTILMATMTELHYRDKEVTHE
mgnify:CR=1 FL=1